MSSPVGISDMQWYHLHILRIDLIISHGHFLTRPIRLLTLFKLHNCLPYSFLNWNFAIRENNFQLNASVLQFSKFRISGEIVLKKEDMKRKISVILAS
jgi:hypothetical protein